MSLIEWKSERRNDYPFVAKRQLTKYKTPHLKEAFCFINLSQTIGRYVSSIAWNPKYSSIFLTSYTSTALCTQIDSEYATATRIYEMFRLSKFNLQIRIKLTKLKERFCNQALYFYGASMTFFNLRCN